MIVQLLQVNLKGGKSNYPNGQEPLYERLGIFGRGAKFAGQNEKEHGRVKIEEGHGWGLVVGPCLSTGQDGGPYVCVLEIGFI